MDNVTHTLFAATLARTPLGRAGRGTTAALIIASNIPDIDIVTTTGGAIDYLRWHRGPTHGPIGIIGLGVITAAIVAIAYRVIEHGPGGFIGARRLRAGLSAGAHSAEAEDASAVLAEARGNHERAEAGGFSRATNADVASFPMLAVVSTIGVLLHVLMDLPTSYGIRILSPFDWHWFAVDWMPIIDVWLLALLAAGLLFGRGSIAARRWNAVIVLTLMAANYGLRSAAHRQALVLAPRLLGPTLPQPCDPAAAARFSFIDSWPRTPLVTRVHPEGQRCLVEIAAMPTFVSPFTWWIIAQMSNAYEIYEVSLLDARFREPASDREVLWRRVRRYPNVWTPAVEKAAGTHLGRVYLGFSRFPAVRTVGDPDGVTTVRWDDMRFLNPTIPRNRSNQRLSFFTVTVRVGPDGRILEERLGP